MICVHESHQRAQTHFDHMLAIARKLGFLRYDPGRTRMEFYDLTVPGQSDSASIRLSWDIGQGLLCYIQLGKGGTGGRTLFLGPVSLCFELPTLENRLADFRDGWTAAAPEMRSHFRLAATMAVICKPTP
jgi:hypothetical protein